MSTNGADVRVVIGRIGRAHGIRGDVAVELRTDEPQRRFADGSTVWHADRALTITSSRPHQGRLLVSFEQVHDRNAAESLHGAVLEADVDADESPEGDEEYYDRQLIGLRAVDASGGQLGMVRDVVHLPVHDLLAIDIQGREVLVPFVAALVPQVDLTAGCLVIADVPGLADPDDADEAR